MHEVGLVEGILEAVQRRAGDRPVAGVRVRIGTLHRASDGPMEQAFEMVGAGTIAEGARLQLIQVPVSNRCAACGHHQEAPDALPACPSCGALSMVHEGGDELILESIEYRAVPVGADVGGR